MLQPAAVLLGSILALTQLLLPSDALAAPSPSACKLLRVADWPVSIDGNQILLEGRINGHPVGVKLDTGANRSFILRSTAERFSLRGTPVRGPRLFGIGGETQVDTAHVEELRIGEAVLKDLILLVAGERQLRGNVAMLLGLDALGSYEIEFDLAANVVRIHESQGCERANLAYWGDAHAGALPMEVHSHILLTLQINGEPVDALLDSGASQSILSLETAQRLGVTPGTSGVLPGGCNHGLGAKPVDVWIGQFRSVAIDNEMIREPKLYFADLWRDTRSMQTGSHLPRRVRGLPDMVLGADFFRTHRVLIAQSQRKVYFSYVGGTVFPTKAGSPCVPAR